MLAGRGRRDNLPMDAGGIIHALVNYGNAVAIPGKPARSVGTFVGTAASIGQEVQCLLA